MRQGAGRLLLVDGDPGIGKTRLVAELARAGRDKGALVLWGRCDEDPVAPFQPFAEALDAIPSPSRRIGFRACPTGSSASSPAWCCVCASTRRPPWTRRRPESERFRFFEAVTATLDELSANGSILLVIDDLHAADQPTLLLLRHVLRGTDEAKLGVVGLFIDTEVPADHRLRAMLADFRSVHPVATVHLQGFSGAGVEELVQGWPTPRRTSSPSCAASPTATRSSSTSCCVSSAIGRPSRARRETRPSRPA